MALVNSWGVHKDRNSMAGLSAYDNGGKGSGNFGHKGRPGEIGGSAPDGGGDSGKSEEGKPDVTKHIANTAQTNIAKAKYELAKRVLAE